jgi:hypothetical protein
MGLFRRVPISVFILNYWFVFFSIILVVSPIYSVFILNYWPVLSEYFRCFARIFSFCFNLVDYIRLVFWSFRYFYVVTAGLSFRCMR